MAKYKIIPSSRTIVQSPISIGHKAEKGVEAIEFDLTAWVETYGSGTLTVIMRRWGDAIPYPIALEIDENNKATWTLSDTDTAKAGMAYAQLSYVVGETVVKKSDIYTFRVMDSLTGEGDPPEAYESWLENLTHLAAEAMAEVLDIEGIVTDKTLTVDGGIADAKATGDALALKADKSTTYTKTEVDQMIEDVEIETDTTLEIAGAPADAAETGRQIGLLKADLDNKIDADGEHQVKPNNIDGVTVSGGNVLDDAERLYSTQHNVSTTDGYVTISNGTAIIQVTGSYCSFLMPVNPNTHYTANHSIRFAVLLKNLSTSGTSPVKYSTVVGTALVNISSFDTGEADHIIVSWDYNTYPIDSFIISKGDTPATDKTITLPDWLKGEDYSAEIESIETRLAKLDGMKPKFVSTTGNLSDGTFLALMGYKQNLRKGERYVFSGNIGTISSLHFGFTNANAFSASTKILNEFTIDATNITYKTDSTNVNYTYQYAHGLTLANNLQFVFEYLPEGNAKITLISNGVLFTQTLLFTKQTISKVVVLSTGSTLTDCKLTWAPTDIEKNIWMFGDSYFAYSTARWTYYLQQYGYAQNTLIDGWPGEGSVNARNSLMTLIQFGTPKYILWCMGMNDGSDTDTSTPNSSWTVRRDEMLTICNNNGITPIFATIPNVPSILHTGKNAWIKASGYRYIDFAKAVGAESAGSTWFTGMLSADNVHPTEQGARALFARVLLDFPEIMLDDWR